MHQENILRVLIKTTISELPSGQQSQSSHEDNHLRAPVKTTISELLDGSSEIGVLKGVLRWLF
jgi:hypothetical protein